MTHINPLSLRVEGRDAGVALRHFPFSGDLTQDEIQQFQGRLVGWKMSPCPHGSAQLGI